MKYLFTLLVALVAIGTVSAATSSTCPNAPGKECNGGPSIALNRTTQKMEMIPQCFPWIFASQYFVMDITDMYKNQNECRAKRFVDFGL